MTNMQGKTYFFLGSSVTYGYAAEGVSFVDYLQQRNQCITVKEAESGTTLADTGETSYVQRMLRNMDVTAKCDVFICQLSTNDASQNIPFGKISDSFDLENFDAATIIGAIEYIIAYAKKTWECPVVFYTNVYYENSDYQRMVDILYQLQKKWKIGILDLWNRESMRNVSKEEHVRYMADAIHPTAAGYEEWWTPVFEEYLQNL